MIKYVTLNKIVNYFFTIKSRLKSITYYKLIFKKFGKKSLILNPILIGNAKYISIGDNTMIRDGVRLEVLLKSNSPHLKIGSNCLIEQNVQIICKDSVIIEDNVSIAGNCAIVDVSHPFSNGEIHENIGYKISGEIKKIYIGRGCFIGFSAVVLPGVHLGEGCVVGANSVVMNNFEKRSIISGNPARIIGHY